MSVNEGDAAIFTVTVDGGVITQDLTVNYTVKGTATAGIDYAAPTPNLSDHTGGLHERQACRFPRSRTLCSTTARR